MPLVDVTVYYLEMLAASDQIVSPPRGGLTVAQAKNPTLAFYRFLYSCVGKEYHWHSRGKLSDVELAAILNNSANEVHVLYVEGTPAGFAELDRRVEGEVELTQFGLMPEFIGQGLGKWFLRWTVDRAWSYRPRRFWLHTCSLDHPTALPNYLKAGFSLFREEQKRREI